MQQHDDTQADETLIPDDDAAAGQQGGDGGMQDDTAALQEELQRLRDVAGRAQADLQNAKARAERESQDIRTFAMQSLIVKLLPTLDNFQRAFQHVPKELKNHEWVKGVEAIEMELMRTMQDAGLQRMQSLAEVSDHNQHEVLTVGPGEEGVVTEVFEEGYTLHGKVIRPAKVKVGDGSE